MALLSVIIAPDPRLKRISRPVAAVGAAERQLMDDMLETMYAAPGIGLAAPQVDILRRIIVVDVSKEEPAPLRMANPELLEMSDAMVDYDEGCLSLPDQFAPVRRPDHIVVRFLDHANEVRELTADGVLATAIQHEMDHLDGILFVDHLSALKRSIVLRRLQKLKKLRDDVPATA